MYHCSDYNDLPVVQLRVLCFNTNPKLDCDYFAPLPNDKLMFLAPDAALCADLTFLPGKYPHQCLEEPLCWF